MLETLDEFNASPRAGTRRYPADDLSGFRWHTGATLRPLGPDEQCPVLFRDIGPAATALFLRGKLPRLAGPLSPITYMRSVEYVEPYRDYERIGRLVILRPLLLHPWRAGMPYVYVARATPGVDPVTIGFVPGAMALADAAVLARDISSIGLWRELLGGREYDEAVAETVHQLDRLEAELQRTEQHAAPLRRRLQSGSRSEREQTRERMERAGLTETDLCAAWHHLPRERRNLIAEALCRMQRSEGDA
jgi:hypothetical protein